jgi:hypothetical protein
MNTTFIVEKPNYQSDRLWGDYSVGLFIFALLLPLAAYIVVFLCFYCYRRKYTKANCQMYIPHLLFSLGSMASVLAIFVTIVLFTQVPNILYECINTAEYLKPLFICLVSVFGFFAQEHFIFRWIVPPFPHLSAALRRLRRRPLR